MKTKEVIAQEVMKRIEKEVEYDATQWNGMLVWEAGDADKVYDIVLQALTSREEALVAAVEESRSDLHGRPECEHCWHEAHERLVKLIQGDNKGDV